jgi:hypothetical protein
MSFGAAGHVRLSATRKPTSALGQSAIFPFAKYENKILANRPTAGVALSSDPSQIQVCAINALPEFANIDERKGGRVV